MRKLILVCAFVPSVALLVGCPKKAVDTDAGAVAPPPVAAAVDAAPAAPVAKNAADIARFPAGEKPLAPDDQKIIDPFTQARTAPHGGSLVASLHAGAAPYKIASFQDSTLVSFPDPKDANTTLMGWIPNHSYTTVTIIDAGIKDAAKDVAVDAAPAPFSCPAGQEAIINIANVAVCRRKCTVDKDCKTPTPGACAAGSTLAGKITKVCANEAP